MCSLRFFLFDKYAHPVMLWRTKWQLMFKNRCQNLEFRCLIFFLHCVCEYMSVSALCENECVCVFECVLIYVCEGRC